LRHVCTGRSVAISSPRRRSILAAFESPRRPSVVANGASPKPRNSGSWRRASSSTNPRAAWRS
jgi:hypothetical protein